MTFSPSLNGVAASTAQSHGVHNQNARQPPSPPTVHKMKVDNPTPHLLPEGENAAPLEVIGTTASDKLVIIMCGLPATGKF